MKIVSWNVNGIRSAAKKGFVDWLRTTAPDVVGLQEVRANPADYEPIAVEWRALGYKEFIFPAERAGYSGVGILTKIEPKDVLIGTRKIVYDVEGRLITADFGGFFFANGYFPKGSGQDRKNDRVPYKLGFYDAVLQHVKKLAKEKPVIVGGDFNTAHEPIDLANPKTNTKTSGFLPEERAAFAKYLSRGFLDVFRRDHPEEPGHYTWWSQRPGVREKNIGWRIDYLLAFENGADRVKRTWIEKDQTGSDHCPLGIEFEI